MTARLTLIIEIARAHPALTPRQVEALAELALCARAARAAGVSHSEVVQVVCQRAEVPER